MTQGEFVENALKLLGQPYSETDCIGVVRKAAHIQCQGTNWLWRSVSNSPKYRYLSFRQTGTLPAGELQNGLLVFRVNFAGIPKGYNTTPDCYHVGVVGLVDGVWSVIQSTHSGVTKSAFNPNQWQAWGKLKQVEYAGPASTPDPDPVLSDHELLVLHTQLLQEILDILRK